MIRLGLYSEDTALHLLLSTSLPSDIELVPDSSERDICGLVASGHCDVVLLDLKSESESQQERFDSCRRVLSSGVCTVVMADDEQRSAATELLRYGADDYCSRRSSIQGIGAIVRKAVEIATRRRARHNGNSPGHGINGCGQMVGSSPYMQRVYNLVNSVADLSVSVLITGESGTGKELIARAIHTLGSRSEHPFVAVAAGSIPDTLLESELFGHEKGAFTGSVGARRGYFEEAGNGTLFLDEIGDISLRAQVMLLRALQQREFCRLGSSRLIPLRARVIFATHRNIEEMVSREEFREDLYYRINVIRINAPALREHPEDIPQITEHYARQYSRLYGKPILSFEPDAVAALQAHAWPGNVRELENVVQRATICARGTKIRADDLNLSPETENVVCINDFDTASSFEQRMRDYKLKLAESAIREHHGNKTQAARSLQISRAYLHRLLRLAEGDEFVEESPDEAGVV
jgi:DNA-binding NtrC family response regulator